MARCPRDLGKKRRKWAQHQHPHRHRKIVDFSTIGHSACMRAERKLIRSAECGRVIRATAARVRYVAERRMKATRFRRNRAAVCCVRAAAAALLLGDGACAAKRGGLLQSTRDAPRGRSASSSSPILGGPASRSRALVTNDADPDGRRARRIQYTQTPSNHARTYANWSNRQRPSQATVRLFETW